MVNDHTHQKEKKIQEDTPSGVYVSENRFVNHESVLSHTEEK